MRVHRRLIGCVCCVVLQLIFSQAASRCRADLWAISSDTPSTFNRLIRFNPATGAELSGGLPTGTPGLARPSGIATGPDGKIYIASRGFDAEGTENDVLANISSVACDASGVCGMLTPFATDFTGPTEEPSSIKFGPDGNLYAAELFYVEGDAVRVYSPSGTRIADAAGPTIPVGIGFDHENNLLVGTAAVPDYMIPATISKYSGGLPQPPRFVDTMGELDAPAAMLRLENNDLLVVDLLKGRIVRITPEGELSHFASIPAGLPSAPPLPSDIVFDPDGNLLVSVLGATNGGDPFGTFGALLRFNREGTLIQTVVENFEPLAGLTWTSSPLTVAGNFDGLGGIDAADYAKWRADFGKFVAPGNGADGNGNGVVDAADYVIWRKTSELVPIGSGTSVPEPSTLVLMVGGLAAAATCRSGRKG